MQNDLQKGQEYAEALDWINFCNTIPLDTYLEQPIEDRRHYLRILFINNAHKPKPDSINKFIEKKILPITAKRLEKRDIKISQFIKRNKNLVVLFYTNKFIFLAEEEWHSNNPTYFNHIVIDIAKMPLSAMTATKLQPTDNPKYEHLFTNHKRINFSKKIQNMEIDYLKIAKKVLAN